ncbi:MULTISPECIES: hypothetical protein [unclassified Streptomyces]|uniref:hypothetical protein n=1 Tax=unclassified Streptomyces TaxID=2593676 RepID=UPI0033ABAC44
MRKTTSFAAAAAAAAALTFGTTTVPAAADASAGAAARCSIKAFGYQGYYKCGTDVWKGYIDWNDDGRTDEVFVIAPDRTIWHTWKKAGGWKVMPGNGRADNMVGENHVGGGRRCVVVYVNKGYHYWQNCFYKGKWHSWKQTG